ncbi:unnamed protein product [Cuscuta epithymum]|uniref:Uncharacterized protein n=1 Tax=Cuscuta epithymum TaxID=186058 RepID=A0AAV0C732_9ASTE|nr:unnamed protein product [Cuscuta epithymum]
MEPKSHWLKEVYDFKSALGLVFWRGRWSAGARGKDVAVAIAGTRCQCRVLWIRFCLAGFGSGRRRSVSGSLLVHTKAKGATTYSTFSTLLSLSFTKKEFSQSISKSFKRWWIYTARARKEQLSVENNST